MVYDAAGFSAKLQKFGVLGGSVISDSFAPIHEPIKKGLSRNDLVELLTEQVKYQEISTKAVGDLAHILSQQKKPHLTFQDANKKVCELSLPEEPFEAREMTEIDVREEIMKYEGDQEIESFAQRLIPTPPPMGRPPKTLSAQEVINIHEFMAEQLVKIIRDFSSLTQEYRHKISQKRAEITAELLVSIAVEKKFDVRSEDVESSLINHEHILQNEMRFQAASQSLSAMMQTLLAYAKPRLNKQSFLTLLEEMCGQGVEAKAFMKQLSVEYSAQEISISDAYARFDDFACMAKPLSEALTPMELRSCYDAYKQHDEVLEAWERSGQEVQTTVQMIMTGAMQPSQLSPTKKLKKLKVNDIISMQEFMVEQLKAIVGDISRAVDSGLGQLKDELAVPLIQGLASAAVEKKFGINAEEMTMSGFLHAATLSTNERFLTATMEQQQLLMQIPRMCQGMKR